MDALFRMLEGIHDLVLQIDARGTIQRAGPRPLPAGIFTTRLVTGVAAEAVMYPCLFEQLRPHLSTRARRPEQITIQPRHSAQFDVRLAWDEGFDSWLLIGSLQPEPERQREDELSQLHEILNTLPHGVLIQDRELRITFVNTTGREMLGWRERQTLHRSPRDPDLTSRFIHPSGAELRHDEHPAARVLATGHAVHAMVMGLFDQPEQQTPRWVEVSAEPLRRHDGAIHSVVMTFADITARKLAVEEMRREHRLLREVMATSIAGVIVFNINGEMLYSNAQATSILGVPTEELLQRHTSSPDWPGMVPDDAARGRVIGAFTRVIQTRAPVLDIRQIIERPDGALKTLTVNAAPVLDEGGEVERVVYTIIDITERAEEEAQRRRLDADMAERARLESLSVLAGGVAHDFNNLLVGILGAADLMERDPSIEELADSVELIRQSARQAASLTQQLLAFSGRASGDPQRVCLNESVRESARLLRAMVLPHITLHLPDDEEVLPVMLDLTHLRQILANLVLNAAQALDAQPGHITLTTSRTGRAGHGCATLEVRDDGPGMDAQTRARIFEPFFTTKSDGHGLGLAAAQGFMRAQGGSIHAESAPGEGTRFILRWPLLEAAPARGASSPPAGRAADDERDRPQGEPRDEPQVLGVLVIDDESLIQRFVRRALSRHGCEVWLASSGEEGLEVFASHRDAIHLALVDLTMPGMSGAQTLHALRALAPTLPLALMSGHRHIDEPLPPDTRLLPKPFSPDELEETIQALSTKG